MHLYMIFNMLCFLFLALNSFLLTLQSAFNGTLATRFKPTLKHLQLAHIHKSREKEKETERREGRQSQKSSTHTVEERKRESEREAVVTCLHSPGLTS